MNAKATLLVASFLNLAFVNLLPAQGVVPGAATKEKPYVNSLGMRFVPVPVPGTRVLFSIWETRKQDYAAYARASSGVDSSWTNTWFTQRDDHPVV